MHIELTEAVKGQKFTTPVKDLNFYKCECGMGHAHIIVAGRSILVSETYEDIRKTIALQTGLIAPASVQSQQVLKERDVQDWEFGPGTQTNQSQPEQTQPSNGVCCGAPAPQGRGTGRPY